MGSEVSTLADMGIDAIGLARPSQGDLDEKCAKLQGASYES